jgi:hypothetical protein
MTTDSKKENKRGGGTDKSNDRKRGERRTREDNVQGKGERARRGDGQKEWGKGRTKGEQRRATDE